MAQEIRKTKCAKNLKKIVQKSENRKMARKIQKKIAQKID